MYDLISIGNISIDLYFKGTSLTFHNDRFQLAVGGKYFADYFHTGVGGGGANVAIGASKLGLKTAVYGLVGKNSFKNIILDSLETYYVNTNLCRLVENYFNISTILLSEAGERTIIHHTTAHKHIFTDNVSLKGLINTRLAYIGNLTGVSLSERETLLRIFRKNDIITVLNLGITDCRRPRHQLEYLLKNSDIILINGHEFAELVKAPYRDIHFSEDIIDWYIPSLSKKIVVITEGEKGSYSYDNGKVDHQLAVKPHSIIDATGAGDAYTAGFITEYLKNHDVGKSMERGAHYAGKILSKIGAN